MGDSFLLLLNCFFAVFLCFQNSVDVESFVRFCFFACLLYPSLESWSNLFSITYNVLRLATCSRSFDEVNKILKTGMNELNLPYSRLDLWLVIIKNLIYAVPYAIADAATLFSFPVPSQLQKFSFGMDWSRLSSAIWLVVFSSPSLSFYFRFSSLLSSSFPLPFFSHSFFCLCLFALSFSGGSTWVSISFVSFFIFEFLLSISLLYLLC